MTCRAIAISVILAVVSFVRGATTGTNVPVELTFTSSAAYSDPANDVTVDAVFTTPDQRTLRVPAFYAGHATWTVRYASPVPGRHTFVTESNEKGDAALQGVSGVVEVTPYKGTNPLYVHGPIRVAGDRRHFTYGDGTPFFWLGDTWWMGLCHRLHFPEEFTTLAEDRRGKGFTVVQIVAGLYPDMFPFDPRGANEAGYPWEKDYARIRPEYFDAADQRIQKLVDEGLSPCIVGAWGYFMPWMGEAKLTQHWRNLIARYGAYPVTWCAAGEANLPWYQVKGFPYDDRKQVTAWTNVMRSIRETDPFHRPLTIHPTGIGRLSARHATDDVGLLDFDMLQTPHGTAGAVAPTVSTVRQSYADQPVMPVIDGEASYEMLGDSIPTEWTRRMFWLCMMNGAAGHTYGANGIWQCNRRGEPHGPSPTAGSPPTGYGKIAWDEAMRLPGSGQEGFGKKLFERFDWQKFEPHPEWAEYAPAGKTLPFEGASWVWYPDGTPATDAPAAKRYFRRAFTIDKQATATLRVTADDRFTATLNGRAIGSSGESAESWRAPRQFADLSLALGENVLAIEAENRPAASANPAGLIAKLQVAFADGTATTIVTDGSWESAKELGGPWTHAAVAGGYGCAPWGTFEAGAGSPLHGPQSTGTPQIRLTYVPDPNVVLLHMSPNATYAVQFFDPVTGVTTDGPKVSADGAGAATVAPPAQCDHDWVLILRR